MRLKKTCRAKNEIWKIDKNKREKYKKRTKKRPKTQKEFVCTKILEAVLYA